VVRRLLALGTCVGLAIVIAFVVHPGPYMMFAFAFVAVPLFAVIIVTYLAYIVRELREREML